MKLKIVVFAYSNLSYPLIYFRAVVRLFGAATIKNTRGGLSVYNPETGYCNNCDNGHVSVIVWESDTVFCTPQIFL